jgi:sugar phosphate permease
MNSCAKTIEQEHEDMPDQQERHYHQRHESSARKRKTTYVVSKKLVRYVSVSTFVRKVRRDEE